MFMIIYVMIGLCVVLSVINFVMVVMEELKFYCVCFMCVFRKIWDEVNNVDFNCILKR